MPLRALRDRHRLMARPIMAVAGGGALLVLTTVVLLAFLLVAMRENDIADARANIEKVAGILAHDMGASLENVHHALDDVEAFVNGLGIDDPDRFPAEVAGPRVHEDLRRRIAGLPLVDALSLQDRQGNVVSNSRGYPHEPANYAHRDYFQVLVNDPTVEKYVGAPVDKPEFGTRNSFLAHRLQTADGRLLGIAVAVLNLDRIATYFRGIDTGDGTAIGLWRDVGVLLARYPPLSDEESVRPSVLRNHAKLLAEQDGRGSQRVIGGTTEQPQLLALRRIPGFPLYVSVIVSEEDVLASFRSETAWIGVGAVLFCLAVALAAAMFIRQMRSEARLIDARSERDRALGELDRLVALNKAKNEFMAHMSHELRTPLNAMIGFAELIRDELFGPVGARQYKEYAGDIHTAGEALLAIINDILNFSAASAGRLRIADQTTDVGATVVAAARLLQVSADKRGLRLETRVAPDLRTISGDGDRLRQILLNLADNAVKFTDTGGLVEIAARNDGDRVVVTVADTGPGMPPEILANAFEPFGRVHHARVAEANRGVGLGLPIAKQLTELMGGTIRLDSTPGQGTRATLAFPAAPTPVEIDTRKAA